MQTIDPAAVAFTGLFMLAFIGIVLAVVTLIETIKKANQLRKKIQSL